MTGAEGGAPPELPPPPLGDSGAAAREAVPRFPDTPLPWVVVLAGLVAGVTGPGLQWVRQPWLVAAAGTTGRWAPPALGVAQLRSLAVQQALWGAAFPLALVVADRVLRRWPRPWRWAVAGLAEGLLFVLVAQGPTIVGWLPRLGFAVIGRVLAPSVLTALQTVLRGLVDGLFARWRRHPSLVFGVAGVVCMLAGWPVSIVATRLGGTSASQMWLALTAQPWWFLPAMLLTSMASSAVHGAVFGYAIVWSDNRRLARAERKHGEGA